MPRVKGRREGEQRQRKKDSFKEKRSGVNAACRGDRSLEKEQPKAVTLHSHAVPITGTMRTFFPSFLLLSFLGVERLGATCSFLKV